MKYADALYTYVPKKNTLDTDGLYGPCGDSEENLLRRYGMRTPAKTKQEVLDWLESIDPGRSRSISVLTEPIPANANKLFKQFKRDKILVKLPAVKLLVAAGVIEPTVYRNKPWEKELEPHTDIKPDTIDWNAISKKQVRFKGIPHWFLITRDGHIPPEYLAKQAALSIRKVDVPTDAEWKEFQTATNLASKASGSTGKHTIKELKARAKKKNYEKYLIELGNKNIGAVQVNPTDNWISSLGIKPAYQNKGYGRQALLLLIAALQNKRPGETIRIGAAQVNPRAKHLYESMGFVPEYEDKKYIDYRMDKEAKLLYHGSPEDIPVLSGSVTKASHNADGKAFLTPDKVLAACFIINKQKILDRLEKQLGHRIENSNFSYDVWKMSPEERAVKDRITVGINVPGIKPFNGRATGYIYSADVPDDKLQQYNGSDMNNEVIVDGNVPYQNKERQRVRYRVQSSV